MRFKRLSYQILLVFVLVILVCVGVSGWLMMQLTENIVTRKISEGDQNFAGRIAQEIETEVVSVKPTLTLLAQTPGLRLMEATELKVEIDRVQRGFPDITSIYVADMQGEQIYRVGTGKLENVSGIWNFQIARGGEKLFSDIYLEPTTLEPMQTITLPIMDSGTVVGVLSADVSFRRIMLSFMGIDIGEGGNVVVVADNGRVVAHTRIEQVAELDLSRLAVVEAVLAGEKGTTKGYTDELGRQVFGSYVPIKELGWGVLIQRPVADIDAEVGQLRTTIIWVMIAAVLLVVPVGWLMSRQIAKPIGQLASASERVAQGDLSTPVDVKSSNEVGVLARSFNQMIVSLKKSRDELQQWGQELRESEEELRKSNEFNFNLIEQSPHAILVVDLNSTITRVNVALEGLTGYSSSELIGLKVPFPWWTEQNPQQKVERDRKAALARTGQRFEERFKKKNGQLFWAEVTPMTIMIDGNPLYHMYLWTDVTKRKQAEEKIKQWSKELERKVYERTAELEQRSQELADTNVSLEEMSRHKSQFLANMSHELRTPLNSIIGYTKLILDGLEGDINEEQQKDLQSVYNNGKHLLELINDLLDLSRIEAGKTVLSYGTFTISDLLAEVIPTVEQLAREKGLTLTYSVAPDIGSLYADKAKTRQVLINILGNAIKFTNEGSVKLNVTETDSDFVFSVTDTGMGMKKEDLEAIFDSFKQVGPAQIAGYEGTGLGLAISKQFIEMQGGRIWAESELGKSSTFTFTLPEKKVASP